MKLQSLAIIFIIIVFPMILVLSYYIGLQIDTVTLYNKYNNELIDATNDAMSAFELNTANEDLSNVSDSLRSIVDASTSTFINTLSTSLGLSNVNKNDIEPYIPAVLYTMYDGYYIYAPTKTPVILEKTKTENGTVISEGAATVGEKAIDGTGYYQEYGYVSSSVPNEDNYGSLLYKIKDENRYTTTIDANTEYKTDYVLKSYMPYSAIYQDGADTATINYTLDNFISISAQIAGVYYTKSGYYIKTSLVTECNIPSWESMGQDELKEYCLDNTNNIKIKVDGIEIEVSAGATDAVSEANRKAITYYLTNTVFSKWVNSNLSFCIGSNMEISNNTSGYMLDNTSGNTSGYMSENAEIFHNFASDNEVIFNDGNDPEADDSAFNNHKYNIIKNSIQYNLNLAISSYSEMFKGLTFEMPLISDTEWKEITEKISIVSFMQGLDCGLKNFNGYAIVSSTNNEMTVIPEEIYYVESGNFNNESSYYHRIDCEKIRNYTDNFISFKSKEVKYDDVYKGETTGYEYDHKNLACYDCIVQNNYTNYTTVTGKNKKIKLRAFLNFEPDKSEGEEYINTVVNLNLQKAYYIAIGKERQNLYKTTAYSKNEGIQTFNSPVSSVELTDCTKVDKFEITLKLDSDPDYARIVDNVRINDDDTTKKAISTTTKSIQTIEIKNNSYTSISISCENGTPIEVLSIKVIYK